MKRDKKIKQAVLKSENGEIKGGKSSKKKWSVRESVSLHTVMIFAILMTGLIVLTLTSAIMISSYNGTIEDSAKRTTAQSVSNISKSIDTFVSDKIETIDNIKKVVEKKYTNQSEMIDDMQTIFDLKSDIVSIVLYDENGEMLNYITNSDFVLKSDITNNQSFDKESDIFAVEYFISDPHVQNIFSKEYPWVVTIATKAVLPDDELIFVTMDIEFSGMSKYIDKISIGNRGYVYVADEYGNIIYHPQQQLLFAGLKSETTSLVPRIIEETTYKGYKNIYSSAYVEEADWYIIGVSAIEEMVTASSEQFFTYVLIIIAIGILISTILGLVLAKNLTSPMHGLMREMEKFEKDIESVHMPESKGFYEVRTLTKSFDHMVLKIKQLMADIIADEQELRKVELKALQAQINPHFLYNTLDSIYWMCQQNGNDEASEMVSALANLFRISISRGKDMITIEDEIKHVESYLVIQNVRYKNQFNYKFQIDPDILKYKCLKITLQPFVENAIYHGIDRMVDEGEILITGKKSDGKIILTVEDNGLGMSEEQVEALFIENSDKAGVGVKNVHNRIKIYFGEEYGISVESELDEGTKIIIEMPIVEGDSYEK